jgi:hypothetical protein
VVAVIFVARWLTPLFTAPMQLRYFLWPPLIGVALIFGYLTAHPHHSPLSYDATRLIHVLTAEAMLALAPFAFVGSWAEAPAAAASPTAPAAALAEDRT